MGKRTTHTACEAIENVDYPGAAPAPSGLSDMVAMWRLQDAIKVAVAALETNTRGGRRIALTTLKDALEPTVQ